MIISLRINEDDAKVIKAYADINHINMSELFRKAVMEKIEDEHDIKEYGEAMAEYKANPVSFSLEEVEKELGLK